MSKRYHKGVHRSRKLLNSSREAHYRSGWELAYMQYLDTDPTVLGYFYEAFYVEYKSNMKSKRMRKYYPDVIIIRTDATIEMIEIKPQCFLTKRINLKKFDAAKKWCEEHHIEYKIVTEHHLKSLNLI